MTLACSRVDFSIETTDQQECFVVDIELDSMAEQPETFSLLLSAGVPLQVEEPSVAIVTILDREGKFTHNYQMILRLVYYTYMSCK